MITDEGTVCVVIAAKNSEATIARAIRSALAEREVAEVVVVDDGSSDGTAHAAGACDDGTGRLAVLSLPVNRGPSFARNHAIAHSKAPLIAILDADDFILPNRFAALLADDDFDFVADNILFVDEAEADRPGRTVPDFAPEPRFLDLAGFIDGNISRRGRQRGEIGFLKPVMRRAFLDRHRLSYREEMRLGEDYELYVRALARGARYKIVHSCGYGAVVRADSLSGRHRTYDLKCLYEADRAILSDESLPEAAKAPVRRHEAHVRGRFELRHFLDRKAELGLARAGLEALGRPSALPAIVAGIAADKLAAFARRKAPARPADPVPARYLLPGRPVPQK